MYRCFIVATIVENMGKLVRGEPGTSTCVLLLVFAHVSVRGNGICDVVPTHVHVDH